MQVVVHVDGGARGNPGPAAAAALVSAPDGRVLDEAAVTLGHATNNVAEYQGLLLGIERAQALGASEVEVINDSELVARQVRGEYKVKHADLIPLHARARAGLDGFARWSIRSVPRAQNAAADALVNRALDGEEVPRGAPAAQEGLLSVVDRHADELWLELMLRLLTAARDELAAGRADAAAPRLRRVVAIWRLLVSQLELLETIAREASGNPLGPAPGSPSPRLRAIEWISGARETWPGPGQPPAGASLYEAFARGLELPAEPEPRRSALAALYADDAADPLHAAWRDAAELLVEHDEWAGRWRGRHASLTGREVADRRFFGELRDVRPDR